MDYKKVFYAPFSTDDIGLYVRSANGVKAFTIASKNPKKEADNLVKLLNDDGGTKYSKVFLIDGTKILTSEASMLVAREWGHLIGAESLSTDEALQTQNDFIDWVIGKIGG